LTPSGGDVYYSVIVFQRYIRRRRKAKKDKDPKGPEKVYKIGSSKFPITNIKERQLILNSFNAYIKNNLVVNRDTFLKAAVGSKQRKKILAETKRVKLELNDGKANSLVQSYIQSKEIKNLSNKRKNMLMMNGEHIEIAKSPFDYNGGPIGPEDINLRVGEMSLESSYSGDQESGETENERDAFYFQSEFSSSLLNDSYAESVRKKEKTYVADIMDTNRNERKGFNQFFEGDDSSIFQSQEGSEDDSYGSQNERQRRNAKVVQKVPSKHFDPMQCSDTKMSDFFGKMKFRFSKIYIEVSNESGINDINKYDSQHKDSLEMLKNNESKSGVSKSKSYATAKEYKDKNSKSESSQRESPDSPSSSYESESSSQSP